MKSKLLICLAFVAGIALGFLLARPSVVHAQGRLVHVTKVRMMGFEQHGGVPMTGTVLGFSCASNANGSTDCYVAWE